MKRFFSRAVAEAIVAGGEELLEPHRREITAVSSIYAASPPLPTAPTRTR